MVQQITSSSLPVGSQTRNDGSVLSLRPLCVVIPPTVDKYES